MEEYTGADNWTENDYANDSEDQMALRKNLRNHTLVTTLLTQTQKHIKSTPQ